MYQSVTSVKPLNDFKLELEFEMGEVRIFDLSPFLSKGRFVELKDENIFRQVRINYDSIEWANGLDLDPEFLYTQSEEKSTLC